MHYRIAVGPHTGRRALTADRSSPANVAQQIERSGKRSRCTMDAIEIDHRFAEPVLDPMDFIARLAALVPRPRAHLTRYHGVFAPNFKHRHHIIPNPAHRTARKPHASRPAPMSWMQRLKRVFHIDIEHCGVCGATLRVIACIETPEVIERILTHLAARNTGCIDYPRAPPLHASEPQPPASPSPTLS